MPTIDPATLAQFTSVDIKTATELTDLLRQNYNKGVLVGAAGALVGVALWNAYKKRKAA